MNELIQFNHTLNNSTIKQQHAILQESVAHSNQAESTVRTESSSFFRAPSATGRYHDSHLCLL